MSELAVLHDPNRPLGTTKVFLPYRPFALQPTLGIEVTGIVVDGTDVTEDALDAARCRVRPHVVGASWAQVSIVLRLDDPTAALIRAHFEPADRPAIGYVARVHCDKPPRGTLLRRGVRLVRAEDGSLSAMLELDRADLGQHASLVVLAVRADESTATAGTFAKRRGARVAISPTWLIEEAEAAGPAGGAFDFAYVDFANPEPADGYAGEDAAHLRACVDARSHVAFRPQGPLILLNTHRREVREVLLAKGTRGVRARLRDVLLGEIATGAWRSIVAEAYAFCRPERAEPDDDDFEWTLDPDHWSASVLEHVVRKCGDLARDVEALLFALEGDRPGLLFEIGERLGRIGDDAATKLLREAEE